MKSWTYSIKEDIEDGKQIYIICVNEIPGLYSTGGSIDEAMETLAVLVELHEFESNMNEFFQGILNFEEQERLKKVPDLCSIYNKARQILDDYDELSTEQGKLFLKLLEDWGIELNIIFDKVKWGLDAT